MSEISHSAFAVGPTQHATHLKRSRSILLAASLDFAEPQHGTERPHRVRNSEEQSDTASAKPERKSNAPHLTRLVCLDVLHPHDEANR